MIPVIDENPLAVSVLPTADSYKMVFGNAQVPRPSLA